MVGVLKTQPAHLKKTFISFLISFKKAGDSKLLIAVFKGLKGWILRHRRFHLLINCCYLIVMFHLWDHLLRKRWNWIKIWANSKFLIMKNLIRVILRIICLILRIKGSKRPVPSTETLPIAFHRLKTWTGPNWINLWDRILNWMTRF